MEIEATLMQGYSIAKTEHGATTSRSSRFRCSRL
jgi:hypothetical protein